jgi:outer membrane protein
MIAAGLAAAAAFPAAAQQPAPHVSRIGYVNTERVLHDSRAAKKVQQELEAEFQKREKDIAAGPKEEIERRRSGLAEDMNVRRDEELKQIIIRINDIVRRLAVAEKIDAVFLEAIYFNARIDLTDKVIKELDGGR